MKLLLLFDQNLSHKLVARLADVYPNALHVKSAGLDKSSDSEVWRFAKEKSYTIVTQDGDFLDIRLLAPLLPLP